MASHRIPVKSCGQVELQWYINYDKLMKRGLVVDAAKYNSESGPTKADLQREIEEKLKQQLLGNLCKGDEDLLDELKEIAGFNTVLICRNVDNGDIYGFALMFVSYRQEGDTKIDPPVPNPVPNILTIAVFCGHGNVCGVGQKMMKSIKKFCADNNLLTIWLDPYDDARNFYSKQGFVEGPDGYMIFNVKEAAAEPEKMNSVDQHKNNNVGMASAAMMRWRGGGKRTRRRCNGSRTGSSMRKSGRGTHPRWGFASTRRMARRMLYRPVRR